VAAEPDPSPSVLLRTASAWLGGTRLGLAVMALVVGAAAGLGAAAFRWLVFACTWLATGYTQFGQQGRVPSLHLPRLGIFFLVVVPIVGGLLGGIAYDLFIGKALVKAHAVDETLDHRQRDIRLQQRHAHLAQRLGDVLFGHAPAAAQGLHGAAEALSQLVEHGVGSRPIQLSGYRL